MFFVVVLIKIKEEEKKTNEIHCLHESLLPFSLQLLQPADFEPIKIVSPIFVIVVIQFNKKKHNIIIAIDLVVQVVEEKEANSKLALTSNAI